MKKTLLGNTKMDVSVIGFGGIPIQGVSQEVATNILLECKNKGINFIDTARGYTVSETYIGNALKVVGRENFYVATKAMCYDYDSMLKSVEDSLIDMNLEYIDLYQINNIKTMELLELALSEKGALKALVEKKKEGKIKHIGVTGHIKEILMEAIKNEEFETVQFPFNFIENQGVELFEAALNKGLGTIAMKPLAGGAITNKKLAIRYIVESELVNVAIPGMDSVEQVRENSMYGEIQQSLTFEEKSQIEKEKKELGKEFCRRCGYCKPCPEGIDIPNIFVYESYVKRYNLPEFGRERYATLPVKADACVRCRKCENKCPYNLPIVEKLKSAVETFKQ